jgi:outer membrane protein TolC
LLNRPLDTALEMSDVDGEIARTDADLAKLRSAAVAQRPELAQIDRAVNAADARRDLARAARLPPSHRRFADLP